MCLFLRTVLAAVLSGCATVAGAQINLYVDSSIAASGAGSSWATAYKTLNEALDIANGGVISTPYNVFVAKGTYYPPGAQSSTDRESTFAVLRGGIRMYGGYPNGGGARDIVSNATVLSGAIGNPADSADNSYHVVVITVGGFNPSSDSTILDGLRITRGAANGGSTTHFGSAIISQGIGGGAAIATGRRVLLRDCRLHDNFSAGSGGGLYMEADSVEIINATFHRNSVLGYSAGGAIFNRAKGMMRITGSSFTGNSGSYGGAIFTHVSPHKLSVDSCHFSENVGGYVGGAMCFADSALTADFLLSNSTFTGNKVLDGGGGGAISFRWMGTPSTHIYRIRHCSFTGNKITYSGGASGGAIAYARVATLRLDTCQFVANRATEVGGAFHSSEGAAIVTGCTFQNDTAVTGGATFSSNSNPAFFNCVFTSNYANQGGACGMTNSSISLTDCIVEGNRATGLGGGLLLNWATITRCRIRGNWAGDKGGGLYLTAGATIGNSLFSGNLSGTSGGGVALNGWWNTATLTNCTMAGNNAANGVSLYCSNTCNFTISNSILWDGTGNTINTSLNGGTTLTYTTIQTGWGGAGNNTTNPQFVSPLAASAAPTSGGDYSLTSCSPAINAGLNAASYAGVTDVVGAPRLFGTTVDRGAYEFQGAGLNPVAVGLVTGDSIVCLGTTDTLFNSVPGGVWSSSNPSVVDVSPTGIISGLAVGSGVISYTHGTTGCPASTATKTVAVTAANSLGPIGGPDSVCASSTVQLSNATPWGTWTSSSPSIATVNAAGVVTGISAGSVTISYRFGPVSCSSVVTKVVQVNAQPVVPAITGATTVCSGGVMQYANALAGGVWGTVSNGTISSISQTGMVTGVVAGSDQVTYTVTNAAGCAKTVVRAITVCGTPVTTNEIISRDSVCVGDTASLKFASGPYLTGVFSVSNSSLAYITNPGIATLHATAPGTLTVSLNLVPILPNFCFPCSTVKSKTIVILPVPTVAPITGASSLCMGTTIQLANATPGGVWATSSSGTKSSVSANGLVTPVSTGTDTVHYVVGGGSACPVVVTKIISITAPQISSITGAGSLCVGASTQFSNAAPGGTWTNFNAALGSVSSGGLYASLAAGTDTVYYQYTSNGCAAQVKKVVAINAIPVVSSIAGSDSVCAGQTLLLTNATAGGTWSSANPSIASVSAAGLVTGISQGPAMINYTVASPQGCSTSVSKSVYVKALTTAGSISGAATLCVNATSSYTNGTAGGQWSTHSNGAVAGISSTGVLAGVAAGVDTIRYTVANASGCVSVAKFVVTVTAPQLAAIAAPDSICLGAASQLSHAVSGGAWTNFSPSLGAVSSTGLYTAAAVGTDTAFYQYTSNGCPAQAKKALKIVKPDTAVIAGSASVCKGEMQALTASLPGGTWSVSNNAVAIVSPSGQVSGISGGTAVISYTVSSPPGCSVTSTRSITIHAPVTTTSQNGAVLTATGNQVGATYQWLNCTTNYQPIAGATAPVYTATSNGQYAVAVSYQGCTDTSACLTVSGTDVKDATEENKVAISYITGSQLMINTGGKVPVMLRLFDAQGKLVKEAIPEDSTTLLDVSDIAKGIYILHLNFRDYRVVNKVNIR